MIGHSSGIKVGPFLCFDYVYHYTDKTFTHYVQFNRKYNIEVFIYVLGIYDLHYVQTQKDTL